MMIIAFYGVWEFLQSPWFAEQASTYATKYAKERLNTDIKLGAIDFMFFPPGAEVKNINIDGEHSGVRFNADINLIGIYFNPFDVFSTSFRIDKVKIFDGNIQVEQIGKTRTKKKTKIENPKKLVRDIFKHLRSVPVNQVEIASIKSMYNKFKVVTNTIKIKNLNSSVDIDAMFENIDLKQILNYDKVIDEISIKANINSSKIVIENLTVKKDFAHLNLDGTILNYYKKNMSYKLNPSLKLPLKMIHEFANFSKIGKIYKGDGAIKGKVSGTGKEFKSTLSIELQDVDTDFAYGDQVNSIISISNESIIFETFKLKHKQQQLDIKKPFEFYNFKTNKWVEDPIYAKAKNLETNNFLKYLRNNLSLIEGNITGDIKFLLGENYYTFETGSNTVINQFVLQPSGVKIFTIKEFKLYDSEFKVVDGKFKMDLRASKGNTSFQLTGDISRDHFEITMPESEIDLSEFSPILNFDIMGDSKISFSLKRDEDEKLKLYLNVFASDFGFDNYRVDEVKGGLEFDFEKGEISFKKIKGKSYKTDIYADGFLNYKKMTIDTKFKIKDLNISQTKRILRKYLSEIEVGAEQISGDWQLGGKIYGKLNPEDIKLSGYFNGKNSYFFNEGLDTFKFKYLVENNKLTVKNFIAKKASGRVFAFVEYDYMENVANVWTKLVNIPVFELASYSKIPLKLQGNLDGVIKAKFEDANWDGEGNVKLSKSKVLSEKYGDSRLGIKIEKSNVLLDFGLLGKEIKVLANLSFNNKKKDSKLELKLRVPDLKKTMGIFSGIDVLNSDFSGGIEYDLNSSFDIDNYKVYDLKSNIKYFAFNKPPILVNYRNVSPEVVIENRIIKNWNMNVRGRKFYVLSKGEGDFNGFFNITSNAKVDASIVEVLNSFVSKANGNIRGKYNYSNSTSGSEYEALITSNSLSLNTKFLPTAITKTNMKLSFIKDELKIERFNAQLVNGFFDLKGGVSFSNVIPDVNIRYEFKDAGLTVLKKSNLIFSGNGSFIGKTFPYTLAGDFFIQKLILVNELTDFSSDGSTSLLSDINYLPGQKKIELDHFVDFNLNVLTRDPVYIKNSIADIGFNGNLQIVGNETDPRIIGKVSLAPRDNKVTFKNNEFVFSKGNIFFMERNLISNPELDFLANTSINEHKISIKVMGPVKNFDFNLASEPALVQSDILSLIAFGYTEDLSSNLSDSEKESMTRASVGSLLFDSFKINETLKNEFGIQVNLGTEISKEEKSYLSQRNSEVSDQTTGVSSATTFELKKQLSDAMSVSVSSTVGDSSTKKQSINLNYNVDKKVSLEGIYETNTTDDDAINETNSYGADLKVKWSFK